MVKIETDLGTGSGAIFDAQGQTGFVITNHHVIAEAGRVRVVVNDSAAYQGTVLGSDPVRDLAVVSICCGAFQSLSFGDASRLGPGDSVFALGYPIHLPGSATLTNGIVSAIRYDPVYQSDVIQTDAAINPGNSGGPMLSVNGEILGIITFKYSDIDLEGLGFAISSTTVQQRIPALRTAAPKATPGPTQAGPTPSAGGSPTFGPISGDLWHEPTDRFIKDEYAGVSFADMIVEATFANPYSAASNSWSYGFILRDDRHDSTDRFILVAVNSDQRWRVSVRNNDSYDQIGGGPVNFETKSGNRNHLRVVAIEDRGWLFVNSEYAGSFDIGSASSNGDVAVITGAAAGDEVAGAVTRFENFKISRLARRYGPAEGTLQKEPGFIAAHSSTVMSRDLVVEADFDSPPGTAWDYGFIIRNPSHNRLEVIGIDRDGRWFHKTRQTGDAKYTTVGEGHLAQTIRDQNHLLLIAVQDSGSLFINGQLVDKLDLSHNQDFGSVSAMGDFFADHSASPSFENFNVWAP